MKKLFIAISVSLIVLASAILLMMRYSAMPSEGYPTWEAVRNSLIRDGEIVVSLPEGVKILSAKCDYTESRVFIDGQEVTIKIGYSWSNILIDTEIDGLEYTMAFHPQKLNNWNRIRYIPSDPSDPNSEFQKIENGVSKEHNDVTRQITKKDNKSEQATRRKPSD